MIGYFLSNTNESATMSILKKKFRTKQGLKLVHGVIMALIDPTRSNGSDLIDGQALPMRCCRLAGVQSPQKVVGLGQRPGGPVTVRAPFPGEAGVPRLPSPALPRLLPDPDRVAIRTARHAGRSPRSLSAPTSQRPARVASPTGGPRECRPRTSSTP